MPIYTEAKKYKVVEISPYIDDFYDFKDDFDFSVALIGYDEIIVSHTNGKYVGFFDDGELTSFMLSGTPYSKMHYATVEMEGTKAEILILHIATALIASFLFGAYAIIVNLILRDEWRKHFFDGVGLSFLRKMILLDKIIFTSTLGAVVLIILVTAALLNEIPRFFVFMIFLAYLVTMIALFLWRDKYGKTH